jgi:cell division protein FtsL
MMNGTAQLKRTDWTAQISDVRVSYEDVTTEQNDALAALTRRYRGRGFTRAAKEHANDMDASMEDAKATSPAYYRWDELCQNGRGDCFRGDSYLGRQVMDVDGFAAYFAECRAMRRDSKENVTEEASAVVPARTKEESRMAQATGRGLVPYQTSQKSTADRIISFAKDWLRPDHPDLRREGKKTKLPVRAISVLAVIAVSLMLIVTSSVRVANAEREAGRLENEVAERENELQLLEDKQAAREDSLEVYRIATEELGMIPATQADSMYVDSADGNSIEVVEQPEEEAPSLSTLLSAIGIDFGS